MTYFVASLLLLAACGLASFGASSFSYLAENVALAHGSLSVLCIVFFLLGGVVAIMANTDSQGKFRSPNSLSALACLLLLIPQGGFAIGRVANHSSSLEIMQALQHSAGVSVFTDGEFLVLNGDIGYESLESLRTILEAGTRTPLLLRSLGGLIDTAINIGELLKEYGIEVVVTEVCESACVIVALSGENLFVESSARFGFHSASALASEDSQLGKFIGNYATDSYISELGALGVPDYILKIAEETPPNEMYYLSGERMVKFGLAHQL